MKLKGKAWKFGANVDTDGIIAGRYCASQDPVELAKQVMEDIAPTFRTEVQKGDIIVGGSNFGCGSSREQAPMAIRGAGVSAVIAESFARIFFRNSINIGLPILESAEAYEGIESGNEIEIDLPDGRRRRSIHLAIDAIEIAGLVGIQVDADRQPAAASRHHRIAIGVGTPGAVVPCVRDRKRSGLDVVHTNTSSGMRMATKSRASNATAASRRTQQNA